MNRNEYGKYIDRQIKIANFMIGLIVCIVIILFIVFLGLISIFIKI